MLNETKSLTALPRSWGARGAIESRRSHEPAGHRPWPRHGTRKELVLVEGKGQTSTKPRSARYGLPFTDTQVRSHA